MGKGGNSGEYGFSKTFTMEEIMALRGDIGPADVAEIDRQAKALLDELVVAKALCALAVRESFTGVYLEERLKRRERNYWKRRADKYFRQARVAMAALKRED